MVHCFWKKKQWSETLLCLTKQPVCVSQGEVLAFELAPGMQGNPRTSNLFQIRGVLPNSSPDFGRKRDDYPGVILYSYPDYSSRVTIQAGKNEMRPTKAC